MKAVEAHVAWADATAKDRKFRALRVCATAKPPLADFEVALPNGLVVVCGLNGVGKTTLLKLVFQALSGHAVDLRPELLDQGTFELVLDLEGDEHTTPLAEGLPVQVALLDAAAECAHLLALARQPNFDDLAEGFDPREWSKVEIAEARYVLGKDYTAIRVTEIDDPGLVVNDEPEPVGLADVESTQNAVEREPRDDDAMFPLIEVEADGLTYDFRGMGLGELAALVLLWRMRRTPANTVLLLEEPETYLSARATTSLVDVLARTVHARRLYALVTTHSPGLITTAPLPAIRVLVPGQGSAVLREPSSLAELESMLGFPSGPARVVLVEDHAAADIVRELVSRFAGSWARNMDYPFTAGHEKLLAVCAKFPETSAIHLVGVLDGDQVAPNPPLRWPVLVLPGPENPDLLLRNVILSDAETFAASCGRSLEDVQLAVHLHSGLDEHDWFHEIAKQLDLDIHGLRRTAVGMWLEDAQNEAIAEQLVADIIHAVSGGL